MPEESYKASMEVLDNCEVSVESMEGYIEGVVEFDSVGLDKLSADLETTVNSAAINVKNAEEKLDSAFKSKTKFLKGIFGSKITSAMQNKREEMVEKINEQMEAIEDNAYDVKRKIKDRSDELQKEFEKTQNASEETTKSENTAGEFN